MDQFLYLMKCIVVFFRYKWTFWNEFRFSIMDVIMYVWIVELMFNFIGQLFGKSIHDMLD